MNHADVDFARDDGQDKESSTDARLHATSRDVPEVPQAHRVQLNTEWLEDLVNAVPGTAMYRYVHTSEGTNLWEFVSNGFEEITGYPASLLVERPAAIYDLVHEQDLPKLLAAHKQAIRERSFFSEVVRMKHKDGSLRWIHSRARPKVYEDGRVVWHGVFVDETAAQEALDAKARAEAALAASEERLRLAFEATDDGFWEWNPQTQEVTLSPRAFQMYGYEPNEVASPSALWGASVDPKDREEGQRRLHEHFAGRLPMLDMAYRFRHKAGHWMHLRVRCKLVRRDEQGRPLRVAGTITDITREKTLEAELATLAMAARETTNAVCVVNRNRQIEWINEAGARIAGISVGSLIGQNFDDLARLAVEDKRICEELLDHMARSELFATEGWMTSRQAQRIYASLEVKPILDSQNNLKAYLLVVHDLTARALTEEKLRRNEEHLREAQEIARLGSWRYLVNTGEVHWSEQLCRAMARDIKDSILRPEDYFSQLEPQDAEKLKANIERAIQDGVGYESCYQVTRYDGTKGSFLARAKTRRDRNGRVVELYGTCQDVTDQVRAERLRTEIQARLASAERLESLGILAGGIAHDFNNLLMGVLMEASSLSHQVKPESHVAEGLDAIQEAAKRMAELTGQLLSYAGRGHFVVEKLDPNIVVTEMLKLLRRNIPPQVSLEPEIADESVTMEIDGSQLRQLIVNLIINASDALEDKPGRISVRTRINSTNSATRLWTLEVSDTGMGMSDELRKKIFDPFFTTKQTGRGLGLSTVLGIVQRCQGTIDVDSTLGHGSVFTVSLPITESVVAQSIPDVPVGAKPSVLRILVADDEVMVRRSLRRMLELRNAEVVDVHDGAAALDALENATEPFDLVLLDVVMPRKTGYEVLAEIRQNHPQLKVVLMSGYNNAPSTPGANGQAHHPDATMQKPFDWNEFERVMRTIHEPKTTHRT